jgi:hypothetical protein
VRFHDLRPFAATTSASDGASTKEIMNHGGWKSIAVVVRRERPSEECDALLAQTSNPYTLTGDAARFPSLRKSSAPIAHTAGEAEGEIVALPPLTSTNDERMLRG